MAEQVVWIAWAGEYDERAIVGVFGNEEAAQKMVSDGLADDYDSEQVLHMSPKPVEDWSSDYSYDLDDKILKKKEGREYLSWIAESARQEVKVIGYQSQYYKEPTPGNPQPAGSGTRPGRTLHIAVSYAESRDHALRSARKFAESWADRRGKMADG